MNETPALTEDEALKVAAFGLDRPESRPNLGLATTRELLDELRARIEVDYFSGGGGLDYTTVSGRPESDLAAVI